MNKKITHTLHLLLTVLVALTGVLPVPPALAATPIEDAAPVLSEAEGPHTLPPVGGDRGEYAAPAAPAQTPEAIDSSPYNQLNPGAAGDSAGNL
jgi:hypothetical protein